VVIANLDLRPYSEEGFFVSSTSYNGWYEPLCEIDIAVQPATTVKVMSYTNYRYLANENISLDELLRMMVDEAKKYGADGLVNVKINEEEREVSYRYNTYKQKLPYFVLTGLAIRRK